MGTVKLEKTPAYNSLYYCSQSPMHIDYMAEANAAQARANTRTRLCLFPRSESLDFNGIFSLSLYFLHVVDTLSMRNGIQAIFSHFYRDAFWALECSTNQTEQPLAYNERVLMPNHLQHIRNQPEIEICLIISLCYNIPCVMAATTEAARIPLAQMRNLLNLFAFVIVVSAKIETAQT